MISFVTILSFMLALVGGLILFADWYSGDMFN